MLEIILARREALALRQRLALAHTSTRPRPCYAGAQWLRRLV